MKVGVEEVLQERRQEGSDPNYRSPVPQNDVPTLRICIIYLARDTLATRKIMEEFLRGYC